MSWSVITSEDPLENLNAERRPAPYSGKNEALNIFHECDYTRKVTLEQALKGEAFRKVRVYADGVYDMFHSGHARQFMQIHALIPNCYLIVGVCSDESTKREKGETVFNENERYEAVRHCRYVDEVLRDAPWTYDISFLEKHKIDFVAHDDIPYAVGDSKDMYGFIKERGMFLTTQRTKGISTTDVITRIIKDYDMYLKRNLERGIQPKDLNISRFTATRVRIGSKVESMKKSSSESIRHLSSQVSEFQKAFVKLFSRDGGGSRNQPSCSSVYIDSDDNSQNFYLNGKNNYLMDNNNNSNRRPKRNSQSVGKSNSSVRSKRLKHS